MRILQPHNFTPPHFLRKISIVNKESERLENCLCTPLPQHPITNWAEKSYKAATTLMADDRIKYAIAHKLLNTPAHRTPNPSPFCTFSIEIRKKRCSRLKDEAYTVQCVIVRDYSALPFNIKINTNRNSDEAIAKQNNRTWMQARHRLLHDHNNTS